MGCASSTTKAKEVIKPSVKAPTHSSPATKGQVALLCTKATLLKVASGGISKDYEVLETLAYSPYMQVRKVMHVPSGEARIVKIIDKSSLASDAMTSDHTLREVAVLKKLDSPSVIRLFEVFEDKFRLYLIEELIQGQDFMQFVTEGDYTVLNKTKSIIRQLLSAIAYIHSQGIVLTTLNLEGISLLSVPEGVLIKLTDFRNAVFSDQLGRAAPPKGTSIATAPEVAAGRWGPEADLWSCGVLLHILVFGKPPFSTDKAETGKLSIEDAEGLEAGLRELLLGLLDTSTVARWTAARALSSPWLSDFASQFSLSDSQLKATMQEMKTFRSSYKLKDAIFTFLSFHVLSNTDSQSLHEAFLSLDKNGDMKVSREELLSYLQANCLGGNPSHEVSDLLSQVDTDGSGFIDYSEFVRASISRRKYASKEYLEMAFRRFDVDGGGKISAKDLEMVIGNCSPETETFVNAVIAEADFNKDGEIDLTEFMAVAMRKF
jgi:calcium-dependent protein kinase